MPKKTIARFTVDYLQIMDKDSKCDEALKPKLSPSTLKSMYKAMVFARRFDNRMFSLQRQGRIGTFAQVKGHEAVQIGAAFAMKKDDWLVPYFREQAIEMYRGVPPENILMFYGGDERGHHYKKGVNVFPVSIAVATQTVHATGLALAFKKKRQKKVVLAFMGDGATSEGDFHEGLNFAAVFKVPCVFICQNNQYAISVPVAKQTAAKTIAQKAIAYDIPTIRVDGNDIFAMYKAVKHAVDHARSGKGPYFIEAFTYRLPDHTTSDDASRYRSKKELAKWEKQEPILRLFKYLEKKKLWNKKNEGALYKELDKKIEKAVKVFEQIPPPSYEDIFKYTYAEITPELQEQMDYVKEVREERAKSAKNNDS